jgi:hypothetical protein
MPYNELERKPSLLITFFYRISCSSEFCGNTVINGLLIKLILAGNTSGISRSSWNLPLLIQDNPSYKTEVITDRRRKLSQGRVFPAMKSLIREFS